MDGLSRSYARTTSTALRTWKRLCTHTWLYNEQLPQKHVSPLQALKRWQRSHPKLFVKSVRNHPAPDTYVPRRMM